MGDDNRATAFGTDAAGNLAADKGEGKAPEDPMEVSMDEEEESDDSENDEMEDDDDDGDNLEPISSENIISGGRRTRGKNIDFQEAAEKLQQDAMDDSDEDDDDEDFEPTTNNDNDNKMRY
ncbi:Histone H2A.Z-specific chaperone [Aspergillus nanangensis]|uniref:Histone H2A.Z-specific chaperone n=1 Tax=Aspergillus nanangensis TaxID=2582783 RepID=A0AAD4CL96_ASPNN|nr:Histone H2A.Z-specific chaperone [Aspergillus nanangensis]